MKRKYLYMLLLLALQACGEKIWYDDLREKTIDTFCGTYRIVSAEWEGDPIDLNGDGIPSTDYYAEQPGSFGLHGVSDNFFAVALAT